MMKGGHGQSKKQFHGINWGALDHASRALLDQLMS